VSALADALVAAQRRALTAMEKGYLSGRLSGDDFGSTLDAIGCSDVVDQERLIAALEVMKHLGAPLPSEPTNGAQQAADEPMTDAQRTFIEKLWHPGVPGPRLGDLDLAGLTKTRASDLISALKGGTYNPSEWGELSVPF
jgi:hypothetical protein